MRLLIALILCAITLQVTTASPAHAAAAVQRNISYGGENADPKMAMDIYTPEATDQNGENAAPDAYPIVIFVHGGGWMRGDKTAVKMAAAQPYLDEGIMVISVNYRLAPAFKFPTFMEDLALSLKWIKDNIADYNGDADRMVLSGHSSGAHMISLLYADPQYLAAHDLDMNMLKGVISIDTASLDLTETSTDKAARMIEFMKAKAFGRDENTRRQASPLHKIADAPHQTPLYMYVTPKRPDAIKDCHEFSVALSQKGYTAEHIVMDIPLTHAEMKDHFFRRGSPMFKQVQSLLTQNGPAASED